jgi:hypothetical protein
MLLPLSLAFSLGLLGQISPAEESKEERAARLEVIKTSVARYDVHTVDEPKVTYRLQTDPILRFDNPVGITKDGAIFLWIGEDGRPEAAIQAFLMRTGIWGHDFTSLSRKPLVAEKPKGVIWRPDRGLDFKAVPGASKPGNSAERRLRQMKEIVESFNVSEDFRASLDVPSQGWEALRPMTKPFARFGKPGTPTIDGGLFCFAQGTDPEAFLMLEAHEGKDGAEWHYAFAPQTICALKASWKGTEVWNVALTSKASPDQIFFNQALRRLE